MFNSSTRRVKLLAAAIWYGGGFVLLWKAWELLQRAMMIQPGNVIPWAVLLFGAIIGILKARYLFARVCKKNLKRIDSIKKPKIWQCYQRRFFVFLSLMVMVGILLSDWSQDRYGMLLSVGLLDLSIGVALLASGSVYWKKKSN